jgi:replication-associated recombination protein RarA
MNRFTPHTKRGYSLFEVASCLQKAIRRGDTALAGYMAIELFESGYHRYCWKRLLTISAEDCAGVITTEIKALFDSFTVLNEGAKKVRSRIFLSKAVIVLCAAMKSRDADHLTNFVYDRRMIDAKRLTRAIAESRNSPEPIELPEYTFDVHTRNGRAKGRTKEQFFKDELAALSPRQIGLFDDLVTPPADKEP